MAAPTRSPDPTPARTGPGRRLLVLAAGVAALLAVLAGCATLDVLTELRSDLEEEGFTDVSTNIARNDSRVLDVEADAPDDTTAEEGQDQAARVVWEQLPRRFKALRVTIDGERRQWSYAELEEELGPRPDDLDTSEDLGDDLNRTADISAVVVLALVGVVGSGLVGLTLFLVVRANRRTAATRPRPLPWMPPGVGPPSGTPVPPPGGWAPASAPPGPPTPPHPHPPATPPSLEKAEPASEPPSGPWPAPPPPPSVPVGRRLRDPDARRLGRRPRGPAPDQAHTPPGWG